MATDKDKKLIYDEPNFAVVSSFISSYAKSLQCPNISFKALKTYIESTDKGKTCPLGDNGGFLISWCLRYDIFRITL